LKFIGLALKESAAASQSSEFILAINDLVQKTTGSLLTFGTSIGWLKEVPTSEESATQEITSNTDSSSFVQTVGTNYATKDSKPKQLLMTGMNIVTAMISAFEEESPDFAYAFESIKLQGWKVVKILVPLESQDTEQFKKAEKAWKLVFTEADDVAEKYMDGDIARSLLHAIETAFRTVEQVADASLQELLENIRILVHDIGEASIEFADRLGWNA